MTDFPIWAGACALGVLLSLAGEYRTRPFLKAAGKLVAATSYLAAAWVLGAAGSGYGQVLLLGMAFCWMGDMLLVSDKSRRLFLLGLASFLLGHIAYIGAFTVRGVSLPAVIGAGALMALFAWRVLHWLKPGLDDGMRRPVWLYVLAISTMMAIATGAWVPDGNWAIPLGALLFLLSDLSVARDRFIAPGFVNRAWGLPLYFCAQMVLAYSIAL